MAIYMNYNGLKVKGNVTAEGYKDWIELGSMQFGCGRAISMTPGAAANREVTTPSLSEVTVTKNMDGSSSGLFKDSVSADEGVKVVIDIVQTGAKKLQKFATYELENALISGYSVSSSSSGAPSESISLSFAKILMSYTAADASNKDGTPERVGYDLAASKPL